MFTHFYIIGTSYEHAKDFCKRAEIKRENMTYVHSNYTLRRTDQKYILILLDGWENRSDYNELQNAILYLNCICLVETNWENLRSESFAHLDKVKN